MFATSLKNCILPSQNAVVGRAKAALKFLIFIPKINFFKKKKKFLGYSKKLISSNEKNFFIHPKNNNFYPMKKISYTHPKN